MALGLLGLGCGDERERERDVVARVAGEGQELELERSVVELIAAREGVGEDDARERALATLRLVAARRAELAARDQPPEHPDDLDPARREQLERAAIARLWLDEVFEPSHRAADIPQKIVDQNMADPAMTRRLFHPELWFVCQALVVPAEQSEGRNVKPPQLETDEAAALAWRAAAGEAFSPLVARVELLEPDLVADESCSVLGRIVGTSQRSFETPAGAVTLRFERFAFAPSEAESFDPAWVEAVTARPEPGVVGPFPSQFGLHLVIVSKIEPALLADESMPADELLAAREAQLREELESAWQIEQLQQALAKARDRRVVRLSPELERGP
ncbi:hypothetical protein ENSA5_07870 [Enhygromyxa salina]|uniref:PpiC domain-containing protein n=1 Tax=Enhygromyxa salina TaxID=215803 RepID=A0A2S9YH02_9BACT|nr:hypothetical protein ENSA5_07870 [Enhygromyxa salina]